MDVGLTSHNCDEERPARREAMPSRAKNGVVSGKVRRCFRSRLSPIDLCQDTTSLWQNGCLMGRFTPPSACRFVGPMRTRTKANQRMNQYSAQCLGTRIGECGHAEVKITLGQSWFMARRSSRFLVWDLPLRTSLTRRGCDPRASCFDSVFGEKSHSKSL